MNDRYEQAGRRAVAKIMGDVVRMEMKIERDAAEADPKAHRLTKVFGAKGANYRYARGPRDSDDREIRFCWSSWRNVAGYFLSWRERVSDTRMVRDGWAAFPQRKLARARSRRWRDDWLDTRAAEISEENREAAKRRTSERGRL